MSVLRSPTAVAALACVVLPFLLLGGGQGAVVAQGIRQYLQRGRPGLIG